MILVNYNSFDPIFVLAVSFMCHARFTQQVIDSIWVNGCKVTYQPGAI